MKHIKLFEDISTDAWIPNRDGIREDINDIAVELLEEFNVYLDFEIFQQYGKEYSVTIYFKRNDRAHFEFNTIKDKLLMIEDYMKIEWINIDVQYHYSGADYDLFPTSSQKTNLSQIKDIKIEEISMTVEKIIKKDNFIQRVFKSFKKGS